VLVEGGDYGDTRAFLEVNHTSDSDAGPGGNIRRFLGETSEPALLGGRQDVRLPPRPHGVEHRVLSLFDRG
jgi:hypothetical protein